ncbi:MAG: hypothetical protein GTO37_10250 [Planctomycetales bacterium]|nr:hypothetical protein [Planctomycetales bacterium]
MSVAHPPANRQHPQAGSQQAAPPNNLFSGRLARIDRRPAGFLPHPTFQDKEDLCDWLEVARLKAVEQADIVDVSTTLPGLPPQLMRLCETPALRSGNERAFFRQMNYPKFRAMQLRHRRWSQGNVRATHYPAGRLQGTRAAIGSTSHRQIARACIGIRPCR